MIRLEVETPISPHIANAMKAAVEAIQAEIEILHPLTVHVVAATCWPDHANGLIVYGQFVESWPGPAGPRIFLAGWPYDRAKSTWLEGRCGVEHVLKTFAHEVVHYCQWRDGIPRTEFGVASEARRLYRKVMA